MLRLIHLSLVSLVLSVRVAALTAQNPAESPVQSWLAAPVSESPPPSINTIEDASLLLAEWDKLYNPETLGGSSDTISRLKNSIPIAVHLLAEAATDERNEDSTTGRCMLGICAASTEEGIATLKSWVTALELPRGLLHGADKDGVPLEITGGVYIKYNSGGVYSFADIRKSGLGFDALWKPGDALLEPYDGDYRGVYFQVELADGEFRQYLVPLYTFGL